MRNPEEELSSGRGEDAYFFWAGVRGIRDERAQTPSPGVELGALSGREEQMLPVLS